MDQDSKTKQCLECGGKDGLHAIYCSMVDTKELEFGSLLFAYIDGSTAAKRGEPKTPPKSLTEDALWCWLLGWDKTSAPDKG